MRALARARLRACAGAASEGQGGDRDTPTVRRACVRCTMVKNSFLVFSERSRSADLDFDAPEAAPSGPRGGALQHDARIINWSTGAPNREQLSGPPERLAPYYNFVDKNSARAAPQAQHGAVQLLVGAGLVDCA